MSDGYHFLPWVRFGLLSGAATPDTFDATMSPRLKMPVKLRVNDVEADEVSVDLMMYGPGDVIGIDPREIVRTEPRHLTPDFPPHLLAAVEFDRPDFPWLFTPASAAGLPNPNRLRPWLVLVVVKRALAAISVDPRRPLPKLTCPVAELPELSEAWLWAHGAFVGDLDGRRIEEQLAARPHQATSRLLCPRRLEASRGGADAGYLACVVPAFEVGRKAGLQEPVSPADATALHPAWDTSTGGSVELPVYHQWEFNTGPAGDFEDAVKELKLPSSLPQIKPLKLDVSRPGGGLPEFPDTVVTVRSVLRAPGQQDEPSPASLQQALRDRLDPASDSAEAIVPPIYGRWQANTTSAAAPGAPPWLAELNSDPRLRVAAGMGAQVVQQQQENLLAAAWDQAGEVQTVNQWLRQKQLAREVTGSIYEKRLLPLRSLALQQITAPVALTVAAASTAPVGAGVSGSIPAIAAPMILGGLPQAQALAPAASPAFRRLTRPLGPTSRRIRPPGGDVPPIAHHEVPGPPPVHLDPRRTFEQEARARLQVPPDIAAGRSDVLAPLSVTPSFAQPMYEPLRELFSHMLLPGLESIPNNSLMLLAADAALIEAYMAGLNDELSRELLWREFPTDLRGTYFRQFWDVRGRLAPDASEAERELLRDVPPMAQWQGALGSHMPPGRGSGLFLLLLKGDLLLRFPNTIIFATRARWDNGVQVIDELEQAQLPQMRVNPAPGVTLLGFSLAGPSGEPVTEKNIAGAPGPPGDAGWFFVLAEHPTEPRFGLDLTAAPLTTWRELSWNDVATRPDGSGYISVRGRTPALVEPPLTAAPQALARFQREREIPWGSDAAAMAYITLQKSFRQEVHAGYWFSA